MDKIAVSSRFFVASLVFSFILCGLCLPDNLAAKPIPKYMDAVKQELTRLGMDASCQETTGSCIITLAKEKNVDENVDENIDDSSGADSTNDIGQISINVDDVTKTIRIAIDDYLSTETLIFETAQRLLELNHKLVVARFSINQEKKSVSLSAIVNTDSNFDRKTFRSVLKGFVQTARALKTELDAQN